MNLWIVFFHLNRRKKSKIKPCDCASLNIANIEMINSCIRIPKTNRKQKKLWTILYNMKIIKN
ncbi:hypothetical protein DERP_004379 [Dermatophagoides pteronyssinus]|uniref:Uncharacterized protein n=1 Tax=Dermatophagoides pteronyssinus TaxID=6956 RepID=A0ABQ8JP46_DERPT|nr:hypothetical protein DERP_004379 [Dermatophagoides pteronyssinus]